MSMRSPEYITSAPNVCLAEGMEKGESLEGGGGNAHISRVSLGKLTLCSPQLVRL